MCGKALACRGGITNYLSEPFSRSRTAPSDGQSRPLLVFAYASGLSLPYGSRRPTSGGYQQSPPRRPRQRHSVIPASTESRDHDRPSKRTAGSLHRPHAGAESSGKLHEFVHRHVQRIGEGSHDRLAAVHLALQLRGVFLSFMCRHFSSFQPTRSFMSSSTDPMPAMPKFSTSTLATFEERNAGRVGPRWMFFTPR